MKRIFSPTYRIESSGAKPSLKSLSSFLSLSSLKSIPSQRWRYLTTIAFLFILSRSTFAQPSSQPKLQGYDLSFPAMGSTITLNAYSDSEERVEIAFKAVRLEIDRLVAILSDYEPNSELNQRHRQAKKAMPVSDELFDVLVASENWYHRSDGAFDAAIGNLTRLWREARKRRELPNRTEIENARIHSGWPGIDLNRVDRSLTLLDPEVRIDFGGIAAGYIVDRAFEILVSHGLPHSLVNDGGDIRCGEAPPGREGWRIEVASMRSPLSEKRIPRTAKNRPLFQPASPNNHNMPPPLRRIYLKNASITTSGDLWQYMEIDGQRRSHILEPKTGYGVLGPSMVTVIAPTCMDADAAATAVSVMGIERGMAFIEVQAQFEAFFACQFDEKGPLLICNTQGFPLGIFDANPLEAK